MQFREASMYTVLEISSGQIRATERTDETLYIPLATSNNGGIIIVGGMPVLHEKSVSYPSFFHSVYLSKRMA